MKMEPIVSSETSAIRTQTPGNYPKRNKLHLEHGESLKTKLFYVGYPSFGNVKIIRNVRQVFADHFVPNFLLLSAIPYHHQPINPVLATLDFFHTVRRQMCVKQTVIFSDTSQRGK